LRLLSAPLDAQFVESLLIVLRERVLFYVLLVSLDALYFEERQIANHSHFALDPGRIPQQRRYQKPSMTIDLHLLAVIIGAIEKLLFGRVEIRQQRQFLFDPLTLLEGIHLSNLPIERGDVKLRAVLLVDQALEFHGDL